MAAVIGLHDGGGLGHRAHRGAAAVEKGSSLLAPILALLGVLVVTREVISVSFPPDPLPVPFPFGIGRLELFGIGASYQNVFIIVVDAGGVRRHLVLLREDPVGQELRGGVRSTVRAAALMGINLSRVTALSFAGRRRRRGLAGLLVSPNISAHYLMGVPLAIQGFSCAGIGGVGRVEGALLGGLLLGVAEQLDRALCADSGPAISRGSRFCS
jgi:branched-chain amino acid transport system permease protein